MNFIYQHLGLDQTICRYGSLCQNGSAACQNGSVSDCHSDILTFRRPSDLSGPSNKSQNVRTSPEKSKFSYISKAIDRKIFPLIAKFCRPTAAIDCPVADPNHSTRYKKSLPPLAIAPGGPSLRSIYRTRGSADNRLEHWPSVFSLSDFLNLLVP